MPQYSQPPRDSALSIFRAALDAANPRLAIHRAMQRDGNRLRVVSHEYDLSHFQRVFVVGFGKGSAAMAQATQEILSDTITRGWVTVKYAHSHTPTTPEERLSERLVRQECATLPQAADRIHLHEAGHPLLDENSLLGTRRILEILDSAGENDLIICLISGGGSALLELPVEGVSLEDLRAMTDVLLRAGATINELNTVRKHISQVKGGQLARRAAKAQIISLILSDVIGSPLDTIASGPTAPDSTTFADALNVIERHGLRAQMPPSVMNHIDRGTRCEIPDTPKANDPVLARVQNAIIADNTIACDAAMQAARERGYNSLLLSTYLQGEAREVAQVLASIAREITASNRPVARPACVIAGGETTVTVRGAGKGGRNQEFVLAAAIAIAGMENVVALSGGTDGTDGPTDATGAIADGTTLARARAQGLDAHALLSNNDAYHFFQPLGDLIITGPTNTNVNDVIILLVG